MSQTLTVSVSWIEWEEVQSNLTQRMSHKLFCGSFVSWSLRQCGNFELGAESYLG